MVAISNTRPNSNERTYETNFTSINLSKRT